MAEFKGIYCAECGCLVGVDCANTNIHPIDNIYCCLCASSFTLVADTLGFISPGGWAGCIEQLPSEQDLVKLDNKSNLTARRWHQNIRHWSKVTRDAHQMEKIRKLQNE